MEGQEGHADAPDVHTGFGCSMSEPDEALRLATTAVSLSLLHRLLVILHAPCAFGGKALFLPRRPADNAALAATPGPIADGTPQLGTSKRWAQWTNGASAMFAHLPREVPLDRSFADFQLHNGLALELQRTSDISVETIERRRRDHAAHSTGDPIWWLDAAGMFKGDYFVIVRAVGDLVLIQPTCSRTTLNCIGALGPGVIFDLAYRNSVLVAAGPLIRTPDPMTWMRLVPLLPILHWELCSTSLELTVERHRSLSAPAQSRISSSPRSTGLLTPPRALLSARSICMRLPRPTSRPPTKSSACL